jgi:hypothetical protein
MINKDKLKPLLNLAEKVLKSQSLNDELFILEYEKFFNCILQGKDIINTYERRHFGISDEEWNEAKNIFFDEIGIVENEHI